MKKLVSLFMALVIAFCYAYVPAIAESGMNYEDIFPDFSSVTVEKEKDSVVVTFPDSLKDYSPTKENGKENGYDFESIVVSDDGSVVYTITSESYEVMLAYLYNSLSDYANNLTIDKEQFPNISKVEINEDFTEYKLLCKSESLTFQEYFGLLILQFCSNYYCSISGCEKDNFTIEFVNETTKEVFDTITTSWIPEHSEQEETNSANTAQGTDETVNSESKVIYEDSNIKITFDHMEKVMDYAVVFLVENKTNTVFSFSLEDSSIDEFTVSMYNSTKILPRKMAYCTFYVEPKEIGNRAIADISEIAFRPKLIYEDYSTLVVDEFVTVSVK